MSNAAGSHRTPKPKRAAGLAGLVLERLRAPLSRFLRSRLPQPHRAEDLEQEIYLRLLQLPNEMLVRRPEAYVFRIAKNVVNRSVRRERQSRVDFDSHELEQLADALSDDTPPLDAIYEEQSREQWLARTVAQLPTMQKAVFVLARYESLSHAQIAARLGLSVHTVKKHMLRAICHCRRALADRQG